MQNIVQAIAQFRANANKEQLEELTTLLQAEVQATATQMEEIEFQQEAEQQALDKQNWEASVEGKEELAVWDNRIALWYNSPDYLGSVHGDRRKPKNLTIVIEERANWRNCREIKATSMTEAIAKLEQELGAGAPHSDRPGAGAKSWLYRWYDYANSRWLTD